MTDASGGLLDLRCWPHPSMSVPFALKEYLPIRVPASSSVLELMETVESKIEQLGDQAGKQVQLQIQVLWNLKDHTKPLGPQEQVGNVLPNGATFGIYGDVVSGPSLPPSIPEEKKLPVTILTGFLGSGKTTLLNYILQEQREKKIAVIENEFGEISIDDALLKQDKMALAEKVIVMDNGCMCCTVRGDLQKGLEEIQAEVKKGNRIDQIIIETTGMADPVPIVRTFMTSPALTRELRLDGVIAVADAKHIVGRLDDDVEEGKVNEAYQQVAFCDKLLLNKLDLVSTDAAIAVKDRLRSINAYAKILPAVRGRVKVSELTNLRAHDMTNFVNTDIEKEAPSDEDNGHGGHGSHGSHDGHGEGHDADCKDDHGHGGGGHKSSHGAESSHGSGHGGGHSDAHGHVAKKSRHDSRVNSMAICREGEIIPDKLGKFMQKLGTLDKEHGSIFRIKGILAVKGHPYKHVFHAVMDVSDEEDAGLWEPGEKKVSKIVFIGKGMNKKLIEDEFEAVFAK